MAAELFPTKKLVPAASVQQYQQQNITNNNTSVTGCNWQGLYPTIRERWVCGGGRDPALERKDSDSLRKKPEAEFKTKKIFKNYFQMLGCKNVRAPRTSSGT